MHSFANFPSKVLAVFVGICCICFSADSRSEERFKILNDCMSGQMYLGQRILTPFGTECWPEASAMFLPHSESAKIFIGLGNSVDVSVADLQKQIEALKAENKKLRTENAQWQKDALKETLDRLNAMPQTFAAQDSVQKTLAPLLTPLVIQEILKDPKILKQIRGN